MKIVASSNEFSVSRVCEIILFIIKGIDGEMMRTSRSNLENYIQN